MANPRKRRTNPVTPKAKTLPVSSLPQLVALSDDGISQLDIALANLVCAHGLPGMGPTRFEDRLHWLDEAARLVKLETDRHYYKFLNDPAAFDFSEARFCVVALVTVLQRKCGVRYNPKWKALTPDCPVPDSFGIDANDLFIPAIIEGIGGTCGSLPVLYAAVGRRLGYPMRLVKAARHLFVRWDDRDGKCWHHPDEFNIEATGPGIHILPDDHYRTWPHPVSESDVEVGIFLKSLTRREEIAEFVATRGYCLQANRRLNEAIQAFGEAVRLAPHNRHFAAAHHTLRTHVAMSHRGHAYLNAAGGGLDQKPVGPFWVNGIGDEKVLVQIVSPVRQPFGPTPDVGRQLIQRTLQAPSGLHVDVWLPSHDPTSAMTAHWVSLSDGRCALVHKTVTGVCSTPMPPYERRDRAQQPRYGPILPHDGSRFGGHGRSFIRGKNQQSLPMYELSNLALRIEQSMRLMEAQSKLTSPPSLKPLAIPAGPSIPVVSNTSPGTHYLVR